MSFKADQIQQIQISKVDEQSVFIRETIPEVAGKKPAEGETPEIKEAKPVWKNAAGDSCKR